MKNRIPENISTITLGKIYGLYIGASCKYKEGATWKMGRINGKFIANPDRDGKVMLIKNLEQLKPKHLVFLCKLYNENPIEESDVTDGKINWFSALIKGQIADRTLPFDVADYLRKEGFHVPVYGIDLFRANIAELYKSRVPGLDVEQSENGHE